MKGPGSKGLGPFSLRDSSGYTMAAHAKTLDFPAHSEFLVVTGGRIAAEIPQHLVSAHKQRRLISRVR
jgi:hypothetical protein